jgi:hypothetical protein
LSIVRIGDLIEWAGKRWVVLRMERSTRSAIIVDNKSNHDSIPDSLDKLEPDECRVLANVEDWPYFSVAAHPRTSVFGTAIGWSQTTRGAWFESRSLESF